MKKQFHINLKRGGKLTFLFTNTYLSGTIKYQTFTVSLSSPQFVPPPVFPTSENGIAASLLLRPPTLEIT